MPLFLGLSAGNTLAVPYRLEAIHDGDEYGDSYTLDYGVAFAVIFVPRRFALLPHQNLSLTSRHLPSEAIISVKSGPILS